MSWDEKKDQILKDCYGKGKTASQIAEIIGNVTRNAVIGRASRLGLSGNIKVKSRESIYTKNLNNIEKKPNNSSRRSKFRNLILDKNFEEAKNISLEELDENTCKYMDKDPSEKDASFCGRKTVEKFSYYPLHLMIVYQTRETAKNKKEDLAIKDEEVPDFIEKKVKSA